MDFYYRCAIVKSEVEFDQELGFFFKYDCVIAYVNILRFVERWHYFLLLVNPGRNVNHFLNDNNGLTGRNV